MISALYRQRLRLATVAFVVLAVSAGLGYLTYRLLRDAEASRHGHPVPAVTVTATTAPSTAPATSVVPPPTLTPAPPASPVATVTQFVVADQGGPSWVVDITALGTLAAGIGGLATGVVAIRTVRQRSAANTAAGATEGPAAIAP